MPPLEIIDLTCHDLYAVTHSNSSLTMFYDYPGRKSCQDPCMIINSRQKDVEVFCVALVTYKLTIIKKIMIQVRNM